MRVRLSPALQKYEFHVFHFQGSFQADSYFQVAIFPLSAVGTAERYISLTGFCFCISFFQAYNGDCLDNDGKLNDNIGQEGDKGLFGKPFQKYGSLFHLC